MKKHFYHMLALCCCAFLLLLGSSAFAQQQITGRVTDKASGAGLPGVSVAVKGTTKGTATGADGSFSVSANKGQVLVFSFVGYNNVEQVIGSGPVMVTLEEKVGSLDEVVVTGYSAQRKKDLTGAVAVVNVDNLKTQPVANVNSQLQGQVSGVTIVGSGQPGQQPQVKIRGINTFGNNTPLYVVDGVPTQNIDDLNPNDIANMQVLKDASSATIYGARAANGVIIISTRRGTPGKIRLNYDGYVGTQRPKGGNVWNLATPQENANLEWTAYKNSGKTPPADQYGSGTTPVLPDYIIPNGAKEGDPGTDPSLYKVNPVYTDPNVVGGPGFNQIVKANKGGTDWFHEIFKPAMITSHNISAAGGSDQGSYFFSANYFNQQGVLDRTYEKRYTVRANTIYNVTKSIRVGENMAYSIIDNPQIGILQEGSGIGMAFREMPIIPVYDIMGNYAGTRAKDMGNARNPMAIQERTRNNKTVGTRLLGNVFGEVDFLKYFTVRTSFGGQAFSFNNHQFAFPEYENSENNTTNSYTENAGNGFDYTWTNTLNYHETFGKYHDVKVLVGSEAFNEFGRNVGGTSTGYFSFDPSYVNLSTGSGTPTNYSNNYNDALYSLFARVDYAFHDKYLISGVVRRDGSSKFGSNNRYGTFPAVSAAWRISQESFMKNLTWINDLKIRGGYGVMGNQINVGPSNAFTLYGPDKNNSYYNITGVDGGNTLGYYRTQIGNPNAKWESDANSNIGFDASLFKGKLEVTADYYRKDIKDLLYQVEVPGTEGRATAPFVNISSMKNTGFDAGVTTNLDITNDLHFTATATITTYKNTITKISDATYFDQESRRFNGQFIIRNAVGHPVSSFYGYKITGFWNSQQEIDNANAAAQKATGNDAAVYEDGIGLGRFKYADTNGDGIITADDKQFLGSPNPKFTYGLNLGLSYKGFDWSMLLYGSQGNKIWNDVLWWTDFYSSFVSAKSKTAVYDSWTPDHHNAKAPIQEAVAFTSTVNAPNSYYVENGSYLRCRNMVLGYTLPADLVKRAHIERLRIYAQAANLFTITKYSGVDPEIGTPQNPQTGSGSTNYGSTNFGIDTGSYPNTRNYIVGVNLTF